MAKERGFPIPVCSATWPARFVGFRLTRFVFRGQSLLRSNNPSFGVGSHHAPILPPTKTLDEITVEQLLTGRLHERLKIMYFQNRQFHLVLLITASLVMSTPPFSGLSCTQGGVLDSNQQDEQETQASNEVSPYAGSYTIMDDTTGTEIAVTIENGVRTIVANGLPNHETGAFPNAFNPNTISDQDYNITLPTQPELSAEPTSYNVPQPFGIATNGVYIDPFAAEWYLDNPNSGWQLAALNNLLGFDENNAHVQPTGAYHYHGPMGLLTRRDQPELIGFAGDGFPIYGPYGYASPSDSTSAVVELTSSYQLKSGQRSNGPLGAYDGTYIEDYEYIHGSGDLDECNGRTGVTPEYPNGTYYYVATLGWPFFSRCFAGSIADSFVVVGGGGRPPPR